MRLYGKCKLCGKMEDIEQMEVKHEGEKNEYAICSRCEGNRLDNYAMEKSQGVFSNYEDYMADRGATICDNDNDCNYGYNEESFGRYGEY